jgi:hypothetical protein
MVILRNDIGRVRKVKTGFSWTGLFFGPLVFLFRGLPKHFFVWIGIFIAGLFVYAFVMLIIGGPNSDPNIVLFVIIMLAIQGYLALWINKITISAWLFRGYNIIGEAPNEIFI